MLGLKKENDHYIFEAAVRTEQLFLNLYHKNRRVRQIAFDPADRIGDVWHLELPVTSGPRDGEGIAGRSAAGAADVQAQAPGVVAEALTSVADAADEQERVHEKRQPASAIPLAELSYCYEADGRIFTDPNGTVGRIAAAAVGVNTKPGHGFSAQRKGVFAAGCLLRWRRWPGFRWRRCGSRWRAWPGFCARVQRCCILRV
mgnify:CR=1 FL=1